MTLAELQLEWYNLQSNFLIEYSNNNYDTVVIYFCSNNLFFPHTKEMFEYYVVKRNRYEWYGTRVKRASKHIFVRDVYKQWYASGLNKHIPNIMAMYTFLKTECKGFKEIVTVGSSAGGYASTLFGIMLGANICFNFNGQWELFSSIENNGKIISPILYDLCKNNETEFLDIAQPEFDKKSVFYFISKYSQWDIRQNIHSSPLKNINRIFFRTSHHGIPFLKCSLKDIIQYDFGELMKLRGNTYYPFLFSCKLSGFFTSSSFLCCEIWKVFKKKLQFL